MKSIRIFLLAAALFAGGSEALAQRFAVGTNAVDWISLGTINAEASIAVSQHVSVHVGAELNPWTFKAGDKETQFEARQNSYWAGARWWPWHVYSGWWAGGDLRYSVYNLGGVIRRETEEGDAFGGGIGLGYTYMLHKNWNIEFGGGIWAGSTKYVGYRCTNCGSITDQGKKFFILPDDIMVSIVYVF